MVKRLLEALGELSAPAELPLALGEQRRQQSAAPRAVAGASAERAALDLLRQKGYRVLCRNRVNRYGELDIVAHRGETVVFVEVRSRRRGARIAAKDTLTSDKRRSVAQAIELFRRQHGLMGRPARADLIAATCDDSGKVIKLEHLEGIEL